MSRLSILFLFFLSICSANASLVESINDAADTNSLSNILFDKSSDANKEIMLSKFPQSTQIIPQTDSTPPTSWVIGLGLCLVFLGYKMKNKTH